MPMSKTRAILYTILASILFGFLPLFVSLAYQTGLSAYDTTFFRFFLTGIVFFFLLLWKRQRLLVTGKQAALLLLMSLVGYVLMNSTLFLSYQYLPVAMATTIHFAYPVVVTVLAFFLYRQKPGIFGIAALVLSFAGILLLSLQDLSGGSITGVVLAFLSAVFLAAYALGAAHPLLDGMSTEKLLFYIAVPAAAALFIGELFFQTTPFARLTAMGFLYVSLISLLCTVVALYLFTTGIRQIGPSMACILATLEPITTIILGFIFLHQPVYWQTAIGCALIIAAVLLVTQPNAAKKAKPEESGEAPPPREESAACRSVPPPS